jgi:hypothetical protein
MVKAVVARTTSPTRHCRAHHRTNKQAATGDTVRSCLLVDSHCTDTLSKAIRPT